MVRPAPVALSPSGPRRPPAEIRAGLLAQLDAAAARGVDGLGAAPLTRGPHLVRRGRWVVCDTSAPGILLVAEVTQDLGGAGIHVGPAAAVLPAAPGSMRARWLAGDYGERDDDPPPEEG